MGSRSGRSLSEMASGGSTQSVGLVGGEGDCEAAAASYGSSAVLLVVETSCCCTGTGILMVDSVEVGSVT